MIGLLYWQFLFRKKNLVIGEMGDPQNQLWRFSVEPPIPGFDGGLAETHHDQEVCMQES